MYCVSSNRSWGSKSFVQIEAVIRWYTIWVLQHIVHNFIFHTCQDVHFVSFLSNECYISYVADHVRLHQRSSSLWFWLIPVLQTLPWWEFRTWNPGKFPERTSSWSREICRRNEKWNSLLQVTWILFFWFSLIFFSHFNIHNSIPFSALTLLAEQQEGHCLNVTSWHHVTVMLPAVHLYSIASRKHLSCVCLYVL